MDLKQLQSEVGKAKVAAITMMNHVFSHVQK
jgi:hypothetical protein